jgi:type IV pilus assembly protein PilA
MNKMNKKGFTIVELVIVIAVIAILAGVLIPTFGGIIDRANESAEMQKVAAAYKEAYALAMSDDGKVDLNDYNARKDGKTVTETDKAGCIEAGGYKFTITMNAAGTEVADWDVYAGIDTTKYTADFDATKGAWTVKAK